MSLLGKKDKRGVDQKPQGVYLQAREFAEEGWVGLENRFIGFMTVSSLTKSFSYLAEEVSE